MEFKKQLIIGYLLLLPLFAVQISIFVIQIIKSINKGDLFSAVYIGYCLIAVVLIFTYIGFLIRNSGLTHNPINPEAKL